MRDAWTLVGRDDEVDLARRAFASGSAGVVLVGEAGIGKTRLAAELAAALGEGAATIRVVATRSARAIPFGAFAALLPVRPVADLGEAPDLLTALRDARGALTAAAEGKPLLLVVDDAHELDPPSAALIHQLVVAGLARVIVTVRTPSQPPDSIVALWKDGACLRMTLSPLGEEETAALAAQALDGPLDQPSVERLFAACSGNPLFLRELLRDLLESGALRSDDRTWSWAGAIAAGPRLAEIVGLRLGQLPEAARDLLELLAVGEPLPLAVADRLTTTDVLEGLERAGIVAVDAYDDGSLRFGHPLFGEILRATLPALASRRAFRRLAVAFDTVADLPVEDRLRGTAFLLEGGHRDEAPPERLAEAARDAQILGDPALAARLAGAAVDAPGGGSIDARLVLGEVLVLLERPHEAEAILATIPPRDTTTEQRGRMAIARIRALAYGCRDIDAAAAVMEAATCDGAWGDVVSAQWATALSLWGRFGEGERIAGPLLDAPDPRVRLRALPAANVGLLARGHVVAATDRAGAALADALAHKAEVPRGPAWVLSALLVDLGLAGRFDDIEQLLAIAHADPTSRLPANRAFLSYIAGRLAVLRGDVRAGRRHLATSVELFSGHDDEDWQCLAMCTLAEAAALAGDEHEAERVAAEAGGRVAALAGHVNRHEMDRALAWVVVARGDTQRAVSDLLEAADRAEGQGFLPYAVLALHDAVRIGAGAPVMRRLAGYDGVVDGDRLAACVASAAAASAGDGDGLDEAASRFEAIGMVLDAAEVSLRAARHHARAGARAAADRSRSRAARLAERCEGARTPGLDGIDGSAPLTARELDVARLAADGLTSREIAERLVVSVRTVDNQLSRVYTKLGIGGRRDLAGALRLRNE